MRILLIEDDSGVAGFIVKGLTEERYAVRPERRWRRRLRHGQRHSV